MIPELEHLIALQRAENELRRVENDLAAVPKKKAELEGALAAERGRLEAAREALGNSQKSRRGHESALQDLEGKRSKYKGQLMDVKTNKEYTAMLHEIENVDREIRGIEDQILVEMEKAEALALDAKREEATFKEIEQRHKADVKALDEKAGVLTTETAKLKTERDAVAATVNTEVLERYERVAKRRGTAVAEAKDGTCQECHVKLRPQFYVELRRMDTLMECPACNRILYYEAPVPVVVPEP